MRWCWLVGLVLCLGGCATPQQEQARTYNTAGVALFQRGEYAAALASFQAALELTPTDAGLLYDAGQCYDRMGDLAKAEDCYRRCLTQAPEQAAGHLALCRVVYRQGRSEEAVKLAEDWLIHEPKQSMAYAADGWLWHQSGDLPRAQSRLQEALALDPHDAAALNELGQVYEALRRPDRARVLYERALEQDPQQPEVVERLRRLENDHVGRPHPDE